MIKTNNKIKMYPFVIFNLIIGVLIASFFLYIIDNIMINFFLDLYANSKFLQIICINIVPSLISAAILAYMDKLLSKKIDNDIIYFKFKKIINCILIFLAAILVIYIIYSNKKIEQK